jgi:hypothetical protein
MLDVEARWLPWDDVEHVIHATLVARKRKRTLCQPQPAVDAAA